MFGYRTGYGAGKGFGYAAGGHVLPPDPGGGVSFIAAAQDTHTSTDTESTIPVPAGAQAGDVLVTAVSQNSPDPALTDLDGWTLLHTAVNPNFDRQTFLAYKQLSGTPPASYTWAFDSGTNRAAVVACFRGANSVTPILDDDWNTGSATPPALMAVDGCAAFGAWRRVSSTGSLDAPAQMTELTNEYGAGSAVRLTTAYETNLVAGSYSRTANATTSNLNASMVLIQP